MLPCVLNPDNSTAPRIRTLLALRLPVDHSPSICSPSADKFLSENTDPVLVRGWCRPVMRHRVIESVPFRLAHDRSRPFSKTQSSKLSPQSESRSCRLTRP